MQLYAARGVVDYSAFLALLRGQLNQKRLTVVKQAFAKLDPQDSGLVAVEDLKRAFDASAHPVLRTARGQRHIGFVVFAGCGAVAHFISLGWCAGRQGRKEAAGRSVVRVYFRARRRGPGAVRHF